MKRVRSRMTFADVVSVLALFVALCWTSYAALTITGMNVKNGSLTGRDRRLVAISGSNAGTFMFRGRDFDASSGASIDLSARVRAKNSTPRARRS